MLETIVGLALMNRLRAVLLMEADFNMHNKLIFGSRMLEASWDQGIIREEHFNKKDSTAEDANFLTYCCLISLGKNTKPCAPCQQMRPTVTTGSTMQSWPCFLAMGMGHGPIRAMLRTIQLMKFFL